MSAYLTFEEENESYRKDSTIRLTMRPPRPPVEPKPSPRRTVNPPTTTRADAINRAYGVRNPEAVTRLRRKYGATRFRRPRANVVTGAERLRTSRAARTTTRSMTRGSGGSGGSGGRGY